MTSYSFLTTPSGSYPDIGGRLTDGTTYSATWSIPSTPIGPNDVLALVGWDSVNPSIRFDFPTATVTSFTIWAADSDGAAGVALPTSIRLRILDMSFDQTFSVTDPAGNGSTVPLAFSGFSVTTSSLVVEAARAGQWTMLSEVTFGTIPEPSSVGLAMMGVGALLCRRTRRPGHSC